MFFHSVILALYSDTIVAASLPGHFDHVDRLVAGPTSSSNLSAANVPAPSSNNASSGNLLRIACDATKFGRNPKVDSCRNVFKFMQPDETQFTFAERGSGVPSDVPLPFRTLGNDGLCFVQPVLREGAISGHASSTQIGEAAFMTLQTCVVQRGMGGMAFNIGGDNNVNVAVAAYKPNVNCDPTSAPGPPWKSCVSLFSSMRANKQVRRFGPTKDPSVEEKLPLVLEAATGGCQLRIDIEGPATVATWYELWEAATAITTMCTRRKRKGGKAKGLGLDKNIRLELSAKKFDPGEQVGNMSTIALPNVDIALQDLTSASSQAHSTWFDRDVPFELIVQDESPSVTLLGDSWTNVSVMASA